MEHQIQVQPTVYEPTRRDPKTRQTQSNSYFPQQLPGKATTNEPRRAAPSDDGYRSVQEPGYDVHGRRVSISSPLSGKELLRRNGEGGMTWQQRRSDRGQEQQPADELPSPDGLPVAPDVPRARPPVSYQRPYVDTVAPAARHGNSRSFSARARSLQQEAYSPTLRGPAGLSASPGEQDLARRPHPRSVSDSSTLNYAKIRSSIPASYSSSSETPALPIDDSSGFASGPNGSVASPLSRSTTRKESTSTTGSRNWASDRSPLQKLEVKLNDISKEEKRARVQEAEQRLKDSKAARGNRRPSQEAASPSKRAPPRRVSQGMSKGSEDPMLSDFQDTGEGPLRGAMDSEIGRRVTMVDRDRTQARDYPSFGTREDSKTYNEGGTGRPNDARARLGLHNGPPLRFPVTANSSEPNHRSTERDLPLRNPHEPANFSDQGPWPGNLTTAQRGKYPAVTALSRSGTVSGHGVPVMIGRDGSRKLQAEQPFIRESKQSYGDPMKPTEEKTRRDESHSPPTQAMQNPHKQSAGYVQPQTAGTQRPRQAAEFGDGGYERIEGLSHEKHHLSNLIHRGQHRPSVPLETPRAAPRRLEEWRGSTPARLTALDFLMEPEDAESKQPWWERKSHGHRRANKAQQSTPRDGSFKDENGQTSFQPPLFLKCGPLLRYTGLKTERVAETSNQVGSRIIEREIWRGSVMIVTVDSDSTYGIEPRLRLFSQPMNLLSPMSQRSRNDVEQQSPVDHDDLVAGLPKLSRTGRTVYVKPVEHLAEQVDFSKIEDNRGLFEDFVGFAAVDGAQDRALSRAKTSASRISRLKGQDGEKMGKYKEVKGVRLHAERGVTFWRFNLEIELGATQACIAYRINRGPAINFWVPAKGQTMNVMFHSCNGFSLSVNPDDFSGPDPMWRDVLGSHQIRPFHVMIGGGDQIYNDAVTRETTLFQEWLDVKNPIHKHSQPFSKEMQDELEIFYLERYSMWFSQGLFGMANSQIPMVNIWDDHDIIDGFGSYPHQLMSSPVFMGLGAVAFKYYMLFQHQSVPNETQADEPSWLLGAAPGPYINELSRSVFMSLGKKIAFLGMDCRTERTRDEVFSQSSYERVLARCRVEMVKGETKHLIVLLGVPIAYPRLVWLENVLTSRLLDPIKALGRAGMLGGFLNQFDGGVEVLDDLDDHWTARNHKSERNWFVEELQELAADKSVRITILGGDVHLAAIGQFYSHPKLRIPKDQDHRYMPNVISSAIVNTPPPEMLGDILNKRNRVHHFDKETEEDMIPIFTHDVDGKPRGNKRLLPRRNWCSIREYQPGTTPPPTPPTPEDWASNQQQVPPSMLKRTLSLTRKDVMPANLIRRLSQRGASQNTGANNYPTPKIDAVSQPTRGSADGYFPQPQVLPHRHVDAGGQRDDDAAPPRRVSFLRRPTNLSEKAARKEESSGAEQSGHINLEDGLDIALNCEVDQKDPAGATVPYRFLVPALFYEGQGDINPLKFKTGTWMSRLSQKRRKSTGLATRQGDGEWGGESSESEEQLGRRESEQYNRPQGSPYAQGSGYSGVEAYKEKGRRRWF